MSTPVRQRDRQAILNALRAGVVPGRGLVHLQVGRVDEIEALANDIRTVKGGGTAIRFLIGEYGTGKSFFLQVIREAAQRADCVTFNADVTQDSRLYGTGGKVRTLFSTLVASAGTKSQPGGGAIAEVLERFISSAVEESRTGGDDVDEVIRRRLSDLTEYNKGPEFADVVLAYWESVRKHDDHRREAALRWLRGEYTSVGEARAALGVRGIISDADFYPSLRLLAMLVKQAGYGGLVIALDELAVLARLNKRTRDQNYEQILTFVNRLLGGDAENLMVVFAGTPEFVTDPIRGLYSYGALRSRLSPNEFLRPGLRDSASPVIGLEQFSSEDLWLLLENVHHVYCSNNQRDPLPDLDAAVKGFLDHAASQLGGLAKVTPREATRSWLQFLDILDQNRKEDWRRVLGDLGVSSEALDDPAPEQQLDQELADLVASAETPTGENLADFQL